MLSQVDRRRVLNFLVASPFLLPLFKHAWADEIPGSFDLAKIKSAGNVLNVFEMREVARSKVDPAIWNWLSTGSESEKTLLANRAIFEALQIRVRRLIDVSKVDTRVTLFGQTYQSPVFLAPIGFQNLFHGEGEFGSASAALEAESMMMSAILSSAPYQDLAGLGVPAPWLQIYARWPKNFLKDLLGRCERAGCPAVALTVDTPGIGKRETALRTMGDMYRDERLSFGNFGEGVNPMKAANKALTWDFVDWLKANTGMKVLLKGIVTGEDALLALEHRVDGIYVSNHGGRQAETGRSTLESLAEVLVEVKGEVPVLVDGGFRRGTDIFKALALGATAVGIGRPQIWGLGAFGGTGVLRVLQILEGELIRIMRFAGTTSIVAITRASINPVENNPFQKFLEE
ncbi:MAG: alpha-hydroxy acid oxidase [Sphingomonadales bacterium]